MKYLFYLLVVTAPFCLEAQRSYTIPANINSNGVQDVTSDLNDFLKSLPDSSVINFRQGKTYRIEETIVLKNRHNLTINGNGATLIAKTQGNRVDRFPLSKYITQSYPALKKKYGVVTSRNLELIVSDLRKEGVTEKVLEAKIYKNRTRSHVKIEGCTNITINNLNIIGANDLAGRTEGAYVEKLEGQHGFVIFKSDTIIINSCIIKMVYGDFFYTSASDNITIQNCIGDGNGRQGFAVASGKNIVFTRNKLSNLRRAAIDLEANGDAGVIENVRITNNEFGPCRLMQFANKGQSYHISNVYYANNIVRGGGAFWLDNPERDGVRKNYIFENNDITVRGGPDAVFRIKGFDGVIIRNNKISTPAERKMAVVNMVRSANIIVEDNELKGLGQVVHKNSIDKVVTDRKNRFVKSKA